VARSTSLSLVAIEGLSRDEREAAGFPEESDDCCGAGVVAVGDSSVSTTTAAASPSAKLTFCFDLEGGCN
jgi:hypothetical protein